MKGYVLLDRDGVINEDSDAYIRTVDQWQPIPGSIDAISRLSQAGFRVLVLTNQSGVGRGYYSIETLNAMHNKMHALVKRCGGEIAGVFFCPHTPDENCDCRKPKTGLISQAESAFNTSLKDGVPFVGDSLRDLQCAVNHGCEPVLVKTGKGMRTLQTGLPNQFPLKNKNIFNNLSTFTDEFLTKL